MQNISLSFPKVWAMGQVHIQDIFDGEVEITEKVDGSQFGFGVFNDELFCRSKGVKGIQDNPPDLFAPAVNYVHQIQDKLTPGAMYWGEALKDKKHNTLTYGRQPMNGVVLFAIQFPTGEYANYDQMAYTAECLGVEVVPCFFHGKWDAPASDILQYLDRESYLGGPKVEGVVVKNYAKPYMIGGQYFPFMAGKYVSEKFKEKHNANWKRENTGKGKFQVLVDNYRAEPRWEKAVHHLRESGQLEGSPRDIGELIKAVKNDIQEEERENIKTELWKMFSGDILRNATRGLPEWYKERLLTNA